MVKAYKGKKQLVQVLTQKWPWQPFITTKQESIENSIGGGISSSG
jgi:hypothetical protein